MTLIQQMEYAGTVASANQIKQLASQMEEVLNSARKNMNTLPDSYKSDASRKIINRFEELSVKFPKFVQDINDFSDFLKNAGETYQNADSSRAGSV